MFFVEKVVGLSDRGGRVAIFYKPVKSKIGRLRETF